MMTPWACELMHSSGPCVETHWQHKTALHTATKGHAGTACESSELAGLGLGEEHLFVCQRCRERPHSWPHHSG
eukprot:2778667-Rhodomonas_salina.3